MVKVVRTDLSDTPERARVSPALRLALLFVALAVLGAIAEECRRIWTEHALDLDDALLLLTYAVALAAAAHYFIRGKLPVAYAATIALIALVRYVTVDVVHDVVSTGIALGAAAFALVLALAILYLKHGQS